MYAEGGGPSSFESSPGGVPGEKTPPTGATPSAGLSLAEHGHRRGGLLGEISLAIPPTVTVLLAVFLLEWFTHQRILFASLAASAFLIYYAPTHQMNTIRVVVTAQLLGCCIGAGIGAFGAGYGAAAVAMTLTVVLLIVLRNVHPPAIATSLGFAFLGPQVRSLAAFLVALGLIVVLVVLQPVLTRWIHRLHNEVGEMPR